jgi:hypothetical protein
MLRSNRIIRPFIYMLIGGLLTALLIPLAARSSWAGQQSIALAPGDQLTVTCPTGMGGAAPGTQAMLTCAAPPPTAVPTKVAGPAITGFSGVQEGQTISGKSAIIAQVAGTNIAKVVFQLDGPKSATHTEKTAPYTFMGDVKGVPNGWDTAQYPNGDYMLSATVTNTSGQRNVAMVHFHIVNGSQATPTAVPTAVPPPPTGGNGTTFVETFDGSPVTPQAWRPANWDVTVHSRDGSTWANLESMHAGHGSNCAGPPAGHSTSAYEDAVFICRDHMMTAINASGYGAIYLTPNQQVDFATGEAVISWDMSTARTSGRDWVDLLITPYQDNLQLPLEDWLPDLNGLPRNALHIRMDMANGNTMFRTSVIRDFKETDVAEQLWWVGYESLLTPDAARRDTFELRLSRTYVRFGMPGYNFFWSDTAIADLGWSRGIVQLGHHSYTPNKDAGCGINQNAATGCAPNTWHWDNMSISPAVPFTILRADRRTADAANGTLNFPAPAPANANLRFAGIGSNLSVSFDTGKTWQPAGLQAQSKNVEEHFKSYWMPIPAGTTSVQIRGSDWWGGKWLVRDVSVWAQ